MANLTFSGTDPKAITSELSTYLTIKNCGFNMMNKTQINKV